MGKVSPACFLLVVALVSIAVVHVNAISFTFYSDLTITTNHSFTANCSTFPWNSTVGGCNASAPFAGRVPCAVYNTTTFIGVNKTGDSQSTCALPPSLITQTQFVKPNAINRTGIANNASSWIGLTLYNFGVRNPPMYEDFPFFYHDNTAQGCPSADDVTAGQWVDPITGKGMVYLSIMTQNTCNLERLVPAVQKAGGAGIVMCEPTFAPAECGYNYYQFNEYGDHEKYKDASGIFVFIMCGATAICGQAKGQVNLVNATGYPTPRPAKIRVWADVNTYLVPTNFWLEGPYFAFVRVCLPLYGYILCLLAAQRLYRFIRQQGGIKFNSLAQWSMLFEMIANFCRGTRYATLVLYLTVSGGYGFYAVSEGLVMCNMILAAVFWGTLDVNSSPLYRFRYLCGFLCVVFMSVTIAIAVEASINVQTYAPIFTHWVFYNECAIGCVVFLFVPRRLWQLSKYQLMQQEMETKPAEAGEEAVKAAEEQADEEDDEEAAVAQQSAEANAVGVAGGTTTTGAPVKPSGPVGHKRRPPIVLKMLYWSCLISAFCVISIAQLICVQVWEDIPQAERYLQDNWFFYQRSTGICVYLMSTCQLLMYTPKKVRRPGQGSTAGSMTNPKTNASTV